MNIKTLWGFRDDQDVLKTGSVQVKAGQTFKEVPTEYAHALIGKGLAEEVKAARQSDEKAEPKATKQAVPKENK